MDELSYRCHRFSSIVIQQAVWLYFRFALSYRDVEDMLAQRGIDVSYETVRRWAFKFGGIIARKLRRGRPRPDGRWHLDGHCQTNLNGPAKGAGLRHSGRQLTPLGQGGT